jgi:hypothetical protein
VVTARATSQVGWICLSQRGPAARWTYEEGHAVKLPAGWNSDKL